MCFAACQGGGNEAEAVNGWLVWSWSCRPNAARLVFLSTQGLLVVARPTRAITIRSRPMAMNTRTGWSAVTGGRRGVCPSRHKAKSNQHCWSHDRPTLIGGGRYTDTEETAF